MDAIVDIQALYGKNGEFLPKEIAVTTLQGDHFGHWVIDAPYDFGELPKEVRASNNRLTCFHHGLEWVDGDTPLRKVYAALRAMCRYALRIYTRGVQKAEILRDVLGRDIINLEEYEGPTFRNMPPYDTWCIYHGVSKEDAAKCALNNVGKIKRWLQTQLLDDVNPIYTEPVGAAKRKDRPSDIVKKTVHDEIPKDNNRASVVREYIVGEAVTVDDSATPNTCDSTVPAEEIVALYRNKLHSPPPPPKRQPSTSGSRGGNHTQYRKRRPHSGHEGIYNEQSGSTGGATARISPDERSLPRRSHPESLV